VTGKLRTDQGSSSRFWQLHQLFASRLERQIEAPHNNRTRDKVMHSPPPIAIWQLEYFHPHGKKLKLVGEAKWYHFDIVGVSSNKKRGSGTVNLNGGRKLFCSGTDPSLSAQASVGGYSVLSWGIQSATPS